MAEKVLIKKQSSVRWTHVSLFNMTEKVKTLLAWIGVLSLLVIAFFAGVIASEKGFISITIPTTPEASRANPAPFGNPIVYKNKEVTVLGAEKIEQIIAKENGEVIHEYMPNGEGYYLIITIQIKNIGSPDDVSYYSTREFKVVGSKGKIYPLGDPLEEDRSLKFIGGNELFEGEFYGGNTRIGRILRPVDADDSDLLLRWEPEKAIFRYLSLEAYCLGKLINIALNDTRVREEINNWSYEIGNITYMEYEARNGELKIKGTFPVVPIYLPSKNEPGVTLLVFINPDDETVIDVGHDYRKVPLPNN